MNIALIGMMGSGKSTVAKLLSEKLFSFSLIDTDSLIVEKEGMSINDIFSLKGEDYFRNIESLVLSSILDANNQVISTGGGIIKSSYNLKLLKKKSKLIYLYADPDTLYMRVKNNNERPLLNADNVYDKIVKILDERQSIYQQADFIIDTVNKSPEMIVNEIMEKLSLYA